MQGGGAAERAGKVREGRGRAIGDVQGERGGESVERGTEKVWEEVRKSTGEAVVQGVLPVYHI